MNLQVIISQSLRNKIKNTFSTNTSGAQYKYDETCLNLLDPYTPKDTGTLIASARLNTKIGSGLIKWKTPYAKAQYYKQRQIGSQTGHLRGYRWGDRMKADNIKHLKNIAVTAIKGGLR